MPSIGSSYARSVIEALDLALERELLERAHRSRSRARSPFAGLVRKSHAPARSAAIAVSSRPYPVSTIGAQSGIARVELLAQLDAGHAGHLDVGDHDVGRVAAHVLEAPGGRQHGLDAIAALPQDIAQEIARCLPRRRRRGCARRRVAWSWCTIARLHGSRLPEVTGERYPVGDVRQGRAPGRAPRAAPDRARARIGGARGRDRGRDARRGARREPEGYARLGTVLSRARSGAARRRSSRRRWPRSTPSHCALSRRAIPWR